MQEWTRLRAPYAVLEQLLGPPEAVAGDKSSTSWYVAIPGSDAFVLVQDRQYEDDASSFKLNVFRGLPSYDWYVWADDKRSAQRCCERLSKQVIAKLGEIKDACPPTAKRSSTSARARRHVDRRRDEASAGCKRPPDLARRFARWADRRGSDD